MGGEREGVQGEEGRELEDVGRGRREERTERVGREEIMHTIYGTPCCELRQTSTGC